VIWWYSTDIESLGNSTAVSGVTSQKGQELKVALDKYTVDFSQLKAKILVKSLEQRMDPIALEALQKELDANNVILKDKEVGTGEAIIFDEAKQEIVLYIPEMALNDSKKLSVQELAAVPRAGQYAHKIISSLYEFEPSGIIFEKPVTISIRVPITGDVDVNKLTPAWYDEKNQLWMPMPGIIDLKESRVVFNTTHFTDFALIELPSRSSFKDVDKELGEAWDAIEILAGQGVVKGSGLGFEPQRSISRAELAQLLVQALGMEKAEEPKLVYKDVSKSDWFAKAVDAACSNKVLTGYPDLTFRPAQKISRYEIASTIYKLDEENMDDYKLICKDQDQIPTWAMNGVRYLKCHGLMKTWEDGNFQGEKPVTRAEAALLLFKYLNLQ
ncbi:MAG: S-layer homology domain-containing protein, partial [Syntrophomonas sp.]